MAQYEEARAALRYARADYYPTIGAAPSASRERYSDNCFASLAVGVTFGDFVLPVVLSYQVNAWGRGGKNEESYREQARAADLVVVNLTMHATAVQSAQRSLELSNTRYDGRVTSYLEVITAQNAALSDEVHAVNILGRRMASAVLLKRSAEDGPIELARPSLKRQIGDERQLGLEE